MSKKNVNSLDYWNERFKGDWDLNKGDKQTEFFYNIASSLMPGWLIEDINSNRMTLCDVGCAQGEGIPILHKLLDKATLTGIDFSEIAIKTAKEKYSNFNFIQEDILNISGVYDVVFSSNTLEHFESPYQILNKLSEKSKKYIVLLLPFEEEPLMVEHMYSFQYNNIPTVVNDFRLIFNKQIDCTELSKDLFFGKQILLVYSKQNLNKFPLTIDESCDLPQINNQLNKQLEEITKINVTNIDAQKELQERIQTLENEMTNLKLENSNIENENKELESKLVQYKNEIINKDSQIYQSNLMYDNIVNSRTWILSNNLRLKLQKIGLIKVLEDTLYIKKMGIRLYIKKLKEEKNKIEDSNILTNIENKVMDIEREKEVVTIIEEKRAYYSKISEFNWSESTIKLNSLIKSRDYKGIIIYPSAVGFEPMQRPQHILREFANKGYLCFFCDSNIDSDEFIEYEKNLFIINTEDTLIHLFKDKHVIFYVTWFMQTIITDYFTDKEIWFDILDRLDFFSLSGNISNEVYKNLIENATLVSYSSKNLKHYVTKRKDAVYLPNGVTLKDFNINNDKPIPHDIESIVKDGKPIIGYYGAIDEWFDHELVNYLSKKIDCNIILIGSLGIDRNLFKSSNIYILGQKPYKELINYARFFDIGIIPFKVNELTNSVSPVKFFEYCAMNLPTVSTNISEMLQYECDLVRIASNNETFSDEIKQLLNKNYDVFSLSKIVLDNQWSNRVEQIEQYILSNMKNLKVYANLKEETDVAITTVTFFKYDGTTYYSGGAERYLIDLNEISKELGMKLRVYQFAEYNWMRLYNDLEVIGLYQKDCDPHIYSEENVTKFNERFLDYTNGKTALDIYSPFFIIRRAGLNKTIGISHGIAWDNPTCEFSNGLDFWQRNKGVIDTATVCDKVVSVDTNTANWFQTINYEVGKNMEFIPNYVDTAEFSPREGYDQLSDKVVITYPRRLYGARGLYIVLDILDEILEKYKNVEFRFVGKGFEEDTQHIDAKIRKWGERVKCYSMPPNLMHQVYKDSDISLIPTLYSEGTSLSCLEAMASGNAVIATRIGGLTDLIIDQYNGRLIEPNSKALYHAIKELLDNPSQMLMFKRKGIESAKAFSKDIWKERWKDIIQSNCKDVSKASKTSIKVCELYISKIDAMYNKIIFDLLSKGYLVYVKMENNIYRKESYGRLQFVDNNEDLYSNADIVIVDKASNDIAYTYTVDEYYEKILLS